KRILERTVGENRASWSDKLEDALWVFCTAFKTSVGCTPYRLVYEKACHLPLELKHKAYWVLKHANFDLKTTGDHRKLQLNELNELRDQAYDNSFIYKERTKKLHDDKIKNCIFNVGDQVLLFNSKLKIFSVQDVALREKLFSITRLISNIESLNENSTPDYVFDSFESDNSLLDNFLPKFETFCDHSEETRSGNTTHADYSLPEYDSFCFEIELDQERLINLMKNDNSDSSNDLQEADLFLSNDSIPPGIENIVDDPEGDVYFLEELLIDDSILFHESSDFNFEDNPSISRPPPEPPDDNFDLEPEVISAEMEDIDEPDEHFNLGGKIFVSTNNEDVDYFPFMFVIRIFLPYLILPEISPLFLSAESEDTIFDPGSSRAHDSDYPPMVKDFLCRIFVLVSKTFFKSLLFLYDNSIPPGIENVADDPEGDIRFLEELLINDSILSHESSDSNFEDNPSISRPPPEPLKDNFDLEPEVILAVMEDIDEPDEHFNPGGEIFVSTNNKDVDYFPFMFVIQIFLPYLILPEISPLLLSA
nr:reverse transcriptase domain-containing protein [Tanacetum cinerariifolium]